MKAGGAGVLLDFDSGAALSPEIPLGFGVAVGEVPVRLQIGGIDLLGFGVEDHPGASNQWLPLNLFEVATLGLACVREVARRGRCAFPLDETGDALLFVADGADTLVHATAKERTARIPYARLLAAWEGFSWRVHHELVVKFPWLRDHPDWGLLEPGAGAGALNWDQIWKVESEGHEACLHHVDAIEA